MSDDRLDSRIATAAAQAVGGPTRFVANTPIVETFNGQIVWEGVVSEFDSYSGKTVYAWAVKADPEPQYIAVLKVPPVTDALTAVRVWLVSQARK
jgi:hypothetical protein